MTYFPVKVILQIHSSCSAVSSRDVFLSRQVDLPFAPYPGVRIGNRDWSALIEDAIDYDIVGKSFICYIEDKFFYNLNVQERREIPDEEINEYAETEYIANGWVRGKDG